MSNSDQIKLRIRKKHLVIGLIVGIATSMIIPYQIFAQNQTSTEPPESETLNAPVITERPLAALTSVFAIPTNNIALARSYYVISFTTSTTALMKHADITFPFGFVLSNAKLIEVRGIGAGNMAISEQTLRYTANSEANIPAGTNIMITVGDIANASTVNNQVTVTTRDSTLFIIDGPTMSSVFTLTRVTGGMIAPKAVRTVGIDDSAVTITKLATNSVDSGKIVDASIATGDIANGSVTAAKLAPGVLQSNMKLVQLINDNNGLDHGWGPDSVRLQFLVYDTAVKASSIISTTVDQPPLMAGVDLRAIAVNPFTNRVYAANGAADTVSVINGFNNLPLTSIAVGDNPSSVDVNPKTNKLYVANRGSGSVSVLNGATNTLLTNIALGGAVEVALNPNTNRIYVTDGGSTIKVIDGATDAELTTIDLGSAQHTVEVAPISVNSVTNMIYVGGILDSSSRVFVIDGTTNSVLTNIGFGADSGIIDLAVNQNTNKIYVIPGISFAQDIPVIVIDGSTNNVIGSTVIQQHRGGTLAVNPTIDKVYVTGQEVDGMFGDESIFVIDGSTISQVAAVNIFGALREIAVNPASGRIYVADGVNGLSVIDGTTNSLLKPTCEAFSLIPNTGFHMKCSAPPTNSAVLNYSIINP